MKIRKKNIPVRHMIARVIGWVHIALIFAPLYALLVNFIVSDVTREDVIRNHLQGLLIVVPVIISWFANRYLRNAFLYLLASAAAVVLTVLLFDQIVMGAPAVLICFLRFYNRLIEEKDSLLDRPSYPGVVLFLIPAFAVFTVERLSSVYQPLSFLFMAIYFLLCFAHHGIRRIDSYVEVNKNMHNMPARRIVRISSALLAGIFLLLTVILIPTLLNNDMNIRYVPPPEKEYTYDFDGTTVEGGMEGGGNEMILPYEPKEPHPILKLISKLIEYLLFLGCAAAAVFGIVYGIIHLSRRFRQTFEDRGDLVENLQDDDLEVIRERRKNTDKLGFFDRSPNALVRRRYKKTVLRSSKIRPERWMTPAEAETNANLTGSKIERLHDLYEKARYSPDGCTKQDLADL